MLFSVSDFFSKDKCPLCSAPIVGTKPMDLFCLIKGLKKALKSDFLLKISIFMFVISSANLLF
jgi:hypothetical protein